MIKRIDQDLRNLEDEKIHLLLSELNSTLDLYYENNIESDLASSEQ